MRSILNNFAVFLNTFPSVLSGELLLNRMEDGIEDKNCNEERIQNPGKLSQELSENLKYHRPKRIWKCLREVEATGTTIKSCRRTSARCR